MQAADEESEIKGHAEQGQPGNQEPGDRASAKCEFKPAGERTDGGLRGTNIGANRHVHADEARGAGQNGADRKANSDQPAEEIADDHKDHHADDGDGGVLPP